MIAGVIHLKLAILNNNSYIINMKPLNLDNKPCSPISSNCVIWQGPDIPCIKLCNGDTVSDIVYKLGTELCTIMDQLNVSNYDLSCLGIASCPPSDFQALIQLIINKVCSASGVVVEDKSINGCPDCVVSVAPCFVEGNTTTMQLVDYVQMIANKVCSIISEISSINNQISVINTTLDDLQFQIDNLPVYTLPSFAVDCILGPGNQSLDVIVEALMNDNTLGYCRLLDATGTPAEINTAVLTQCILDGDQPLAALPTLNTMSAYYSGSWVGNAALSSEPSVANAIKNIWVSICDIREYVSNLSLTVQDTSSIDLTYTGGVLTANIVDTGWVNLNGFDFYTSSMVSQKPQCRRIGNQIHFRGVAIIPLNDGLGGVTNVTSSNNYYSQFRVTPYVGPGGIVYDSDNRLLFNSDGVAANSVIPTSVLDAGTNLDSSYVAPQLLATRKIIVSASDTEVTQGVVLLTAAVNLTILANKTLRVSSIRTIELDPADTYDFTGSSLLRGLTSSFSPRSKVIDFTAYVRSLDGNMSMNTQPLINTTLVAGNLYRIINYVAGDNFTNVGAIINDNNQTFIATGTVPTTWTNGTQLINITQSLHYDGFNNSNNGSKWPAITDLSTPDFDAGRYNNLGGFILRLDGMIAFV